LGYDALKESVLRVNQALVEAGLIVLTWGNASGIDRKTGAVAIKPSGVAYDKLKADDIVIVSLKDGAVMEGKGRPSSDTPTHLELYRSFENIGGIVHTHSFYATCFCQACKELPCFGTTHADHFHGTIPVTRVMTAEEIQGAYELNTGKVIVERFRTGGINPDDVPGVLIANHGPFTWGSTVEKALENAIVLESVARMNLQTSQINGQVGAISNVLLDKHFLRKHGAGAYYGQK
jgi:L-ribulose-5-phosphate 4-epimerase